MSGVNCWPFWTNACSRRTKFTPWHRAGHSARKSPIGDRTLKCQDIESFDFSKVDLVLMSAGGSTAKQWCPKIAKAGAITIDNSSAWRMDPDVPLVVPECNGEAVMDYKKKMIIANPNCSTAQLVVALKPLHDAVGVKRVVARPTSPSPAPARMPWTSCGTRRAASM
jgi:aspartate-semialdehyde dehydrogenase